MTCECCGRTYVDEVALFAIEDAVMGFREAVLTKTTRDEAAWAEAEAATQRALREAKA